MTGKKKPVANLTKTVNKAAPPIRDALRPEFYESIAEILRTARTKAYRAVNFTMVEAYWNVGRKIAEEEQQGEATASYGEALMRNLSARLTIDVGKGFNVSNVFAFRQFYLSFSKFRAVRGISANDGQDTRSPTSILSALRRELTWTHYRLLIRVERERSIEEIEREKALIVRERGGMANLSQA